MKNFVKCLFLINIIALFFINNMYAQEEFKFQQTDDEDGLVVMEAENNSEIIVQDGLTNWEATMIPVNFSGTSGMQAVPADGSPYADGEVAKTNSAVLSYSVNFVKEGNTYIWARNCHSSKGDDSFHAGLDNIVPTTASFIAYGTDSLDRWYWISYLSGDTSNRAYFYAETGVHDFKVYIRECGFKIDKIILTTNVDYKPSGLGPDETLPVVDTSDNDTTDEKPNAIIFEPFNSQKPALIMNYPNPFYAGTTISYNLDKSGQVSLKIYNVSGQLVSVLINDFQNAGTHNVYWNTSDAINQLAGGIYYAELITDTYCETIRMLRIK